MIAEEKLAELLKIEPDLHALMLAVNRAWLSRYHPDAEYASVIARLRDDLPRVSIPIISDRRVSALPLLPLS